MGTGVKGLVFDGIFGILFIMLGALGEYLDKNPMGSYHCPSYCAVDHKHIMEDYGHNTDNRDSRNTCSCSCRARMGMYVSDKVHNEGCCKGPKRIVRDNSETD